MKEDGRRAIVHFTVDEICGDGSRRLGALDDATWRGWWWGGVCVVLVWGGGLGGGWVVGGGVGLGWGVWGGGGGGGRGRRVEAWVSTRSKAVKLSLPYRDYMDPAGGGIDSALFSPPLGEGPGVEATALSTVESPHPHRPTPSPRARGSSHHAVFGVPAGDNLQAPGSGKSGLGSVAGLIRRAEWFFHSP